MKIDIIDQRLKTYNIKTIEDEEHALKEILQEIALYGLASANFFEKAIFHGGTALRILHQLPRFSEDLDFLLKAPDPHFRWEPYIDGIITSCKQYGVQPDITDKSRMSRAVKKMFLKDNSIGKIINLSWIHHARRKLAIKFEIDTLPPAGSGSEIKFLEFPLDYSVLTQDLSSSFAGKCHALLCREYIKGRDWYDFTWYVSRKISPNFVFLKSAIYQQGPWANQNNIFTTEWFIRAMEQKIKDIDWNKAANDVSAFLNEEDKKTLNLWGIDFFISKLNKLEEILARDN
ncbi:MAG TPA: nucleotidyl transferase AbiEii/AbiGii toxin family protein [Gammaproteobacteria bacterium]|jgi:predicted nucleotidyltransferase component of viral defense system|nr:nucleotidyl transferase AbiEii/AbiGii toxin family protein [Gammaproteobacteria bacterium]